MNKFKNASGTRLLKGLFFEMTMADKSSVLYTLKDEPHEGYPSLYQLYMQTEDLTEWKFANEYLDGWDHWERLCNCEWFKPFVERWRKELFLKAQSEALNRIRAESKSNSKNAFTANKYILERAWEPKGKPEAKRGRPSKDEVKRAASEQAELTRTIDEDFARITSANETKESLH